MEDTAKEVMLYGNRIKEIEIDVVTHQFQYTYKGFFYLITMHRGNIISCYLLA
jgi:hypothetical protein